MSIGLVLEGGAMRRMYTAGVLDVFLDNQIEVDGIIGVSAGVLFVSKIVEINGKKYLDGGLADSIPIEKCKELGYDKILVVLTRPIEYRKKKANERLTKIKYSKYPNLVKTINNRYQNYNNTVEKIIDMENEKEIFVIRPSRHINLKRIERNKNKLQEMYDLGVEDCKNKLEELKKYLT